MLAALRRTVAWQVYVRCHMVYPLTVPRRIEWIPARYDSIYFDAMAIMADEEGSLESAAEYRRIAAELREEEAGVD